MILHNLTIRFIFYSPYVYLVCAPPRVPLRLSYPINELVLCILFFFIVQIPQRLEWIESNQSPFIGAREDERRLLVCKGELKAEEEAILPHWLTDEILDLSVSVNRAVSTYFEGD